MPMTLERDLDAPALSTLRERDDGDFSALPLRCITQAIVAAEEPALTAHPLSRHHPRSVTVPRVGELHLWRFRCEWLPVPVQEGDTWLPRSERERARLHPNAALRKRFISARVVVRWIVGHLFDCKPRDVDLHDDGNDKLRARDPRDGRTISIDIAYAGIWIVIAMAPTALGLSVVMPSLMASPALAFDGPHDDARQQARDDALRSALRHARVDIDSAWLSCEPASFALDLAGHGWWHMLDLPMGGKIRAAIVVGQPVTAVSLFGWPKGTHWSGFAT
jgi:hypothetical protein